MGHAGVSSHDVCSSAVMLIGFVLACMHSRQAAKDAATHGKQAVVDVAEATYKAGEETVGATQGAAESTWQKIKDTVTGHHTAQDRLDELEQLARDTQPTQEQAESTWQKIKDAVTGKW